MVIHLINTHPLTSCMAISQYLTDWWGLVHPLFLTCNFALIIFNTQITLGYIFFQVLLKWRGLQRRWHTYINVENILLQKECVWIHISGMEVYNTFQIWNILRWKSPQSIFPDCFAEGKHAQRKLSSCPKLSKANRLVCVS